MAKKKTDAVKTSDAKPQAVKVELTVEQRCEAAFMSVARAAIELEQLTPAEREAFAALVAVDGTPLHVAEDGTESGKLVRHGEHDPQGLRCTCSQRFEKIWAALQTRLQSEQQGRDEKKNLLARQQEMLAKRAAAGTEKSAE